MSQTKSFLKKGKNLVLLDKNLDPQDLDKFNIRFAAWACLCMKILNDYINMYKSKALNKDNSKKI